VPYTLTPRVPTPQEHRDLAESVGWGESFWWDAVPASLSGSVCGAVAHDQDGALVGMGRVVGDGAFYFYVQDVVVRPEHQGRGLGRALVESLTAQVRELSPGHCFVGLFATPAAQRLYRSLGWDDAETAGLWRVLRD
jgi:GNAT superfamily N-acetyltransferase